MWCSRVLAAVAEELIDRVAEQAARIETTKLPLEVCPAQDQRGAIGRSLAAQPTNAAMEVATPVMVWTALGSSSM